VIIKGLAAVALFVLVACSSPTLTPPQAPSPSRPSVLTGDEFLTEAHADGMPTSMDAGVLAIRKTVCQAVGDGKTLDFEVQVQRGLFGKKMDNLTRMMWASCGGA
jgi:hypothetical protein